VRNERPFIGFLEWLGNTAGSIVLGDLHVIAFQSDVTRVTTLMVGREGSVRVYPEVDVADPHHPR
jgi:hypothetical protein